MSLPHSLSSEQHQRCRQLSRHVRIELHVRQLLETERDTRQVERGCAAKSRDLSKLEVPRSTRGGRQSPRVSEGVTRKSTSTSESACALRRLQPSLTITMSTRGQVRRRIRAASVIARKEYSGARRVEERFAVPVPHPRKDHAVTNGAVRRLDRRSAFPTD